MNMNTLATIHTKFQGETMVCFVCIATFFGYILGVNKVIECVIAKHSNNNGVIKTCNKYTQTNLNDLVEYLASNNIVSEKYSNKRRRDTNDESKKSKEEGEHDVTINNENVDEKEKEKVDEKEKEKENVEHVQSPPQSVESPPQSVESPPQSVESPPQSVNSDGHGIQSSSTSNSEEDYEVVKKSENVRISKNKINFFEWFSIL